jgi:hypothetical protein
MTVSIHAAISLGKPAHDPNPAQRAKAAEPAVKGAEFGAMVAAFAKAQGGKPASEPPVA